MDESQIFLNYVCHFLLNILPNWRPMFPLALWTDLVHSSLILHYSNECVYTVFVLSFIYIGRKK